MSNGSGRNNTGKIKKAGDMRGMVCLLPFINMNIYSYFKIFPCCNSWLSVCIGDFSRQTLREIWNGNKIKSIRQSILDGSFLYCNWHQCPFYDSFEHPLYRVEDLRNPENLPPDQQAVVKRYQPWINHVIEGRLEMGILPANFNIDYDESCNLACPSCRTKQTVFFEGPEYELRVLLHNKLFKEIGRSGMDRVKQLTLSGSGEVFMSKIFTKFLFNLDGRKYPDLNINLMSNGLMFTEATWNKMEKIHGNINEVIISLDAARAETYAKVCKNGSFSQLLSNLGFLSSLRKGGKIRRLMLSFIVQLENYKEMPEAVRIAGSYAVDLILFSLLSDWQTWPKEIFETHAVWKSYHPQFRKFLDMLKDPVFENPVVQLGNLAQYRTVSCSDENVSVS